MNTTKSKNDFSQATVHRAGGMGIAPRREKPGAAFLSLPAWQIERARRLHRVCMAVEKSSAKGRTLRRAMRWPLRTARNQKVWRVDSTKKIRLSRQTLIRLYYHWRNHGRNAEAFTLHYRPRHKFTLTNPKLRRFIRIATGQDVTAIETALRQCANAWHVSTRTLLRKLPAEIRRSIRQLHRLRIKTRMAEKRFKKFLAV